MTHANENEEDEHHEVESIKQKVTFWFSIASPNGFNRLAESKFKLRIFWFVVISTCYIGMIIHLSFNFQQFFSFDAATGIQFETVAVELPDITVCRVGTPADVHINDPFMTGIKELLFEFIYRKIESIDKMRYRDFYFARVADFRKPNASRENIGMYLILCNYGGELCDFRNFTILRDPFFYNCFTFTPRDRGIALSGKVLSLGLHVDASNAIVHDEDFLVVLHEQNTRPDTMHKHYVVRKGGTTQISFSTIQIKLYSRPNARCEKNKTVKYLYSMRKSPIYKYRKMDCFWEKVQEEMLKQCKCISPYGGVLPRFKKYKECHSIPPLSEHEKKFLHAARMYEDARTGKLDKSEVPPFRTLDKRVQRAAKTAKKKIRVMRDTFKCHERVLNDMIHKYSKVACKHACVRDELTTSYMFGAFREEEVRRIGEFLMPSSKHRNATKWRLKKYGLFNDIANATIEFAEEQYTSYWSRNTDIYRNETKRKALQARAFKEMAMLEIFLTKVPGDAIVETQAYPFFKLLSDVGGNMGLWAGFSIISLFEVIELFMMVIGRGRKNSRIRNRQKKKLECDKRVEERQHIYQNFLKNQTQFWMGGNAQASDFDPLFYDYSDRMSGLVLPSSVNYFGDQQLRESNL